jgi:hypothetical protein
VALVLLGCASSRPVEAFPRTSGQSSYEVQLLVNGVPAREYQHDSRYYVEGRQGDRYALRVRNNTGRRVEVVASVDGLDVVDGKSADFVNKRGYVIGPWQSYDIEGFRVDMGRVAAFRFSSVGESYAAKLGKARNVGVIGVAFFAERQVVRRPPPQPVYPDDDRGWWGRWGGAGATRADQAGTAESAEGEARTGMGGGSGGFGHSGDLPAAKGKAGPAASAPADSGAREDSYRPRTSRPGLGTEFGEARGSSVRETTFVRASTSSPTQTFTIWYNDRAGLIAQGVIVVPPPPSDSWLRATANPFPANPPRTFATPPAGWRED